MGSLRNWLIRCVPGMPRDASQTQAAPFKPMRMRSRPVFPLVCRRAAPKSRTIYGCGGALKMSIYPAHNVLRSISIKCEFRAKIWINKLEWSRVCEDACVFKVNNVFSQTHSPSADFLPLATKFEHINSSREHRNVKIFVLNVWRCVFSENCGKH
jgi:hypothetical protein